MEFQQTIRMGVVYCIKNLKNGRIYIGSSLEYGKRKSVHLRQLKQNKHHNFKLQSDFNEGHEFEFSVMVETTQSDLRKEELSLFKKHKPFYNIALDTVAPMEGRKHSAETIEKFKKVIRPKGYKKEPWTPELRAKMKIARTGLKRDDAFKERRRKEALADDRVKYLKESIEELKKPVSDNKGNTFDSLSEAAEFHGISVQTVCDILKGRHSKTRKGVTFEYSQFHTGKSRH